MNEVTGNLWTHEAQVRVITTNGTIKSNGAVVMGRGCAREARDSIPGIDLVLGRLVAEHGNRCFRLTPDLWSFPVKHHWQNAADPDLICTSAGQLGTMLNKFGVESLVMPRPGCGNGHLTWSKVKPLLLPLLDDRVSVITFG